MSFPASICPHRRKRATPLWCGVDLLVSLPASLSPEALIAAWGLWALMALVMLESVGLPLPGETALVSAAVYAGATKHLDIVAVIATAAAAAMIGDNIGYLVGRKVGLPLALRFGPRIGLDESRLKLGRYLFQRHGGTIVFLGRFVALLRTVAAVLAGLNAMPWPRFVVANAAGAVGWAVLVGGGAWLFGHELAAASRPVRIALVVVAAIGVAVSLLLARRHEHRLIARAEAALPGPLAPP